MPFIGYVWGIFLIVDTTHVGNLIGYRAGRRGLHGKLFLHLRTGYIIQMGRYLALAAFLALLAACSASPFVAGVAKELVNMVPPRSNPAERHRWPARKRNMRP